MACSPSCCRRETPLRHVDSRAEAWFFASPSPLGIAPQCPLWLQITLFFSAFLTLVVTLLRLDGRRRDRRAADLKRLALMTPGVDALGQLNPETIDWARHPRAERPHFVSVVNALRIKRPRVSALFFDCHYRSLQGAGPLGTPAGGHSDRRKHRQHEVSFLQIDASPAELERLEAALCALGAERSPAAHTLLDAPLRLRPAVWLRRSSAGGLSLEWTPMLATPEQLVAMIRTFDEA